MTQPDGRCLVNIHATQDDTKTQSRDCDVSVLTWPRSSNKSCAVAFSTSCSDCSRIPCRGNEDRAAFANEGTATIARPSARFKSATLFRTFRRGCVRVLYLGILLRDRRCQRQCSAPAYPQLLSLLNAVISRWIGSWSKCICAPVFRYDLEKDRRSRSRSCLSTSKVRASKRLVRTVTAWHISLSATAASSFPSHET